MKRGSVRKVWVTTSVFRKIKENKYFQEFKPLMFLEWALGRLPYSFEKQGFAPFKLLSFSVLYTIVFFAVQTIWTIYTMSVIAKLKIYNAPSYDEALYWVSTSLLLILNITTPITKWIDSRQLIKFVNSWQKFQDDFMNSELEVTLSRPIKIASFLILPSAVVSVAMQRYLVTNLSLLVVGPFVLAFSGATCTLIEWCGTLHELRVISRLLLKEIIMNGCRRMSTYRRAWLELSRLVSAVGDSHAYTGMMSSVIFFSALVLSSYTLLSKVFETSSVSANTVGLIIGALTSFVCKFILCDAAYRTTQEVGPTFCAKILALDLTHLSQSEITETCLLLQTMSEHPPAVGYLGFLTINRHLFVTTIANAVTYLVVLVQFKASSPLDADTDEFV